MGESYHSKNKIQQFFFDKIKHMKVDDDAMVSLDVLEKLQRQQPDTPKEKWTIGGTEGFTFVNLLQT